MTHSPLCVFKCSQKTQPVPSNSAFSGGQNFDSHFLICYIIWESSHDDDILNLA